MEKVITINRKVTAGIIAVIFALAFLLPIGAARAADEDILIEESEATEATEVFMDEADPDGAVAETAAETKQPVIVVDPGHIVSEYGYDNGASAPDGSTNEAKLNPVMAAQVATVLQNKGFKVYTTFKVADNIPYLLPTQAISLYSRTMSCNSVNPDLFISIHHNSFGSGFNDASGALSLYSAEQEKVEMRGKSVEWATMVSDSVRTLSYAKGNRASGVMLKEASVMKYSTAPAITFEVGFLTNRNDLAYATNSAKRQEIAVKIGEAADKFFAKYPPVPDDKEGPKMKSLALSQKSPTYAPNFTIRAKGVTDPSGVKEVKFRIFRSGESSSQKNVMGSHDGVGNWKATFKLAQFANKAGTYKITAYGTDNAGNTSNMGTVQIVIKEDKAKPTMKNLVFGEQSPTFANAFAMQAQGVSDLSGVKEVKFRVWRSGASSTAKTYMGVDKGNGNWDATFKLADFGNKAGTYMVKVYGTDKRGNTGEMKSGSIVVKRDTKPPTMQAVLFGEKSPTDQPQFAIRATGVKDDDKVKAVRFRVWSVPLGTASAKTYEGIDKGNGNWDILLSLKDFKYTNGLYKVNVYGYDRSGNNAMMGSGSITVKGDFDTQAPTANAVLFSEKSPTTSNNFTMQAQGVSDRSGVEWVKFRVYNEADGASKYKTYVGKMRGNNWEATFDLHDFKNRTGTYVVKAYGCDKMGNSGFMKQASIKITGDTSPPYMERLLFSVASPTYVQEFTIQANDVTDPSGIDNIRFRVWNKADTKTVKSYEGVANGKNYDMTFKLSDFGNKSGDYAVKVYGTDKKGNTGVIGEGSITVGSVVGSVPIMGGPQASVAQMVNFFKTSGYKYPSYYEEAPRSTNLQQMAQLYYDVCQVEGVKAEVAWAQMCLETKFLNFGGDVHMEQFNFAGIGATGGGNPGYDFAAEFGNDATGIKYGVIAQVQHLKAYGSTAAPVYVKSNDKSSPDYNKPIDPRFNLVKRGCAPNVEGLSGTWAVGKDYGQNIIIYINRILNASNAASLAEEELIEEVFADMAEEKVTPEPPDKPDVPEESIAYPVMNDAALPDVTKQQLMNYYIAGAQNVATDMPTDPQTAFPLQYGITLEQFVDIYMEEAAAEGVNAEVAFAQAMTDTNYLRFGGNIAIEDNVFMAYDNAERISYPDVATGVRAQIQHLKCVASRDELKRDKVDALWDEELRATVKDAAKLNGDTYGAKLLADIKALLAMPAEVVNYIVIDQPEAVLPKVPEEPQPNETAPPAETTPPEETAPPEQSTPPAETEQPNGEATPPAAGAEQKEQTPPQA